MAGVGVPGILRHTGRMGLASVLVVEDDTFSRTLIVSTLEAQGVNVVASTASATDALKLARVGAIDVALLDLDLGPGPTGFELSVLLRRDNPRMGIVFLTSYQDPRLLIGGPSMIPVGSRFVQKSELRDPRPLVQIVLQAKSHPLAIQKARQDSGHSLTAHQLQVLKLVAAGKSTKDIARATNVSDKAVEATISRVQRILGSQNEQGTNTRVSLVRAFYAITGRTPPRD
jgi:DNA-binding NarL/FixJ family response regulator